MKALRRFALFSLVLLAAVAAQAATIDSLALVPRDAVSVGSVRIADLRTSPIVGRLFDQTDRITTDGEAWQFMQETGLQPAEDVDTIVFALMPESTLGDKGKMLMLFEGRFDPAKLAAFATKKDARRVVVPAGTYFKLSPPADADGDHQEIAVAFDRSLVIAGSESAVVSAMNARKSGGTDFLRSSGLGRDFARIDVNATAWLLVDVQRATRLTGAPKMPSGAEAQAIASALKTVSTLAVWGKDAGDALQFQALALSADAETRELLEDLLRGAVAAWRMTAQEKQPEFVQVLRKFDVDRNGDGVSISGSIPAEFIKTQAKTASK